MFDSTNYYYYYTLREFSAKLSYFKIVDNSSNFVKNFLYIIVCSVKFKDFSRIVSFRNLLSAIKLLLFGNLKILIHDFFFDTIFVHYFKHT